MCQLVIWCRCWFERKLFAVACPKPLGNSVFGESGTFCPSAHTHRWHVGGADCAFHNLITDRDGTINNYCGRYKSSVQSAYNSIFLSRFATDCCQNSIILTAAPLQVR